ncbi:cobalamin B12-binding domain-containing protein [Syntrophaceticus schinkii]|uniref:Trimethylamine corrinoid protein n=1 Tax=Syntrophaceticus schinkii TaxID=499207 RepID=A0A0B7MKJ9_9FIRM|nr:corrinoid protein [Syntrophaceticus schinkii]CEO88182.1 Trimethylamine corrinoid protein [Syntrophaceticus schinkii]
MDVKEVYGAVLDLDVNQVLELVNNEISNGTDVLTILNDGLIAALDEVGKRFSEGQFFVPEMLMAAKAVQSAVDEMKPYLMKKDIPSKGTIVIGTVAGDLHDIGKNLVSLMLEGAGYKVIDLGINVDTETFITSIRENKADIVALSALLTTTMPAMEKTVKAIRKDGLNVKIMVGGAPVTAEFARKIGADGYSKDAPGAGATKLGRDT